VYHRRLTQVDQYPLMREAGVTPPIMRESTLSGP
jgi:hypothetical protein